MQLSVSPSPNQLPTNRVAAHAGYGAESVHRLPHTIRAPSKSSHTFPTGGNYRQFPSNHPSVDGREKC